VDGFAGVFGDEALAGEAVDDAGDGDMGDSHALGECADAGGALVFDELRDGFDIVLGGFVAVGVAGLSEAR